MEITERGRQFIRDREGFRHDAYQDQAGVWTIGYGHTEGVKPGDTISLADAELLFHKEIEKFENCVIGALEDHGITCLKPHEFDALVSLTYNIGCAGFRRSTVLRRLGRGDIKGAADAILMWDKITVGGQKFSNYGLARRRRMEKALFLGE
jgi:lysozyme